MRMVLDHEHEYGSQWEEGAGRRGAAPGRSCRWGTGGGAGLWHGHGLTIAVGPGAIHGGRVGEADRRPGLDVDVRQ
jgi:hypothetical protein